MKTWQGASLLLLGLATVLVASTPEEETDLVRGESGRVCDLDEPAHSTTYRQRSVTKRVLSCFIRQATKERLERLKASSYSLQALRDFFAGYCTQDVHEVAACLADLKQSVAECKSRDVVHLVALHGEITQHLAILGCEDRDGENLAQIARGIYLKVRQTETLAPFWRCLAKKFVFYSLANGPIDMNVDIASDSHIFYRAFVDSKTCLDHIDDADYKAAARWLLDEVTANLKCKHPEQDILVLCSEVDVTKLPNSDVCKMGRLKHENLYNVLEDNIINDCYYVAFNQDEYHPVNSTTDIQWLHGVYKEICERERNLPECLLQNSAYGESCLSREDNQHFQLEVQAMEDYMTRMCVDDGAFLANLMHEVFKNTPEHGHVLRDCSKTVEDAATGAATVEGHAVNSKSVRFYHDCALFKKCVVEKLSATNSELVSRVDTAYSDVLRKVKCVNPEDGLVVLCETIHQH